mgnify:CR=1 FL=1
MSILKFPTARKAPYRNPIVRVADLPANAVSIRHVATPPRCGLAAPEPVEPRKAQFPELAQSPELALIMAMFAALPAKARRQVSRQLSLLAWRNGGSGVEAPNAAYDLVFRMNAILDREKGR